MPLKHVQEEYHHPYNDLSRDRLERRVSTHDTGKIASFFLWYFTIKKAIVEYLHVVVLVQSKVHHIMDGGMIQELGWGMGACKTLLHNSRNLY